MWWKVKSPTDIFRCVITEILISNCNFITNLSNCNRLQFCYSSTLTACRIFAILAIAPTSVSSLLFLRGLDLDWGSEGGRVPLCGRGSEGPWGSLPEESDCCGTGALGSGAQQAAACQCSGTPHTISADSMSSSWAGPLYSLHPLFELFLYMKLKYCQLCPLIYIAHLCFSSFVAQAGLIHNEQPLTLAELLQLLFYSNNDQWSFSLATLSKELCLCGEP